MIFNPDISLPRRNARRREEPRMHVFQITLLSTLVIIATSILVVFLEMARTV